MSLNVESSEVLEVFLWKEESEIDIDHLKQEIGDTYYSLLLLCNKMNIDLEEALLDKLEINKKKYPITKCYGKNLKYTEL
ncbi:MAG: MazG-like family protein [Chitinophagales bacterium]